MLDKLTAKARGGVDIALVGRPLNLSAPEPWQEPVDGGALFDAILIAIRLYVVLDLNEAITLVLGAVATHLYDVFTIFFPRLAVTSPEKRSGKTTLLDILAALVLRPLLASNISTAAVFRTIETAHPRLLVDEADRFLK